MGKIYSFGLDFFEPKKGELCFAPIVNIYIHIFSKWGKLLLIAPECRSMEEVNYEINRLQGELEDVRESAKKKFGEYECKRDKMEIGDNKYNDNRT